MEMKFNKIYIEITNKCNLNCKFCIKNNRPKEVLSFDNFKLIINKIKGYTEYIYLHIMGEPLLNPYINQMIKYANDNNIKVNITTNGYLINTLKNVDIRQINISLHSFNKIYNKNLENYLNDIFDFILKHPKTYISLRMWANSAYKNNIIKILEQKYKATINCNKVKLSHNIFYEEEQEFIWPSLTNNIYNECGTCKALKTHIGILVNGDIVPCCLDSNGSIILGNIFKNSLADIIESTKYKDMLNGFNNNYKLEVLCKKCNFYQQKTNKF